MAGVGNPEPVIFVAGDSVSWTKTASDYPASTWTLVYYFNNLAAGQFDWTTTADGDDYQVSIPAADTDALSPGRWNVAAVYSDGTDRATEQIGTIFILPNPTKAGQDFRTSVQRKLEAAQAVLEGRATKDQESYSLEGRSLSRMPIKDLVWWVDRLAAEARAERDAFNRARGGSGSRRTISVAFS